MCAETAGERYRGTIVLALRRTSLGLALGLLAAGVIAAGMHPELARSMVAAETATQQRVGAEVAVAGIYLEESGIPMPVPSEVSLGYLGQRLGSNPLALFATWLGLTTLIVLGSTNLFVASRKLGPRLISSHIGMALHLTPSRLRRAQSWIRRWGPLAIGVSRYVPGLRWAMAVACGTLGVGYRTFWCSTAVSAAIWAGVMLTLGVTVGDAVGRAIVTHAWIGLLLPLPAAAVVTAGLVRVLARGRTAASTVVPRV